MTHLTHPNEKTFGYLGRVPSIYFGLWAGSSFPFFEVFGLRAGLSIAKFASDGQVGGPRLRLDTSLITTTPAYYSTYVHLMDYYYIHTYSPWPDELGH